MKKNDTKWLQMLWNIVHGTYNLRKFYRLLFWALRQNSYKRYFCLSCYLLLLLLLLLSLRLNQYFFIYFRWKKVNDLFRSFFNLNFQNLLLSFQGHILFFWLNSAFLFIIILINFLHNFYINHPIDAIKSRMSLLRNKILTLSLLSDNFDHLRSYRW